MKYKIITKQYDDIRKAKYYETLLDCFGGDEEDDDEIEFNKENTTEMYVRLWCDEELGHLETVMEDTGCKMLLYLDSDNKLIIEILE